MIACSGFIIEFFHVDIGESRCVGFAHRCAAHLEVGFAIEIEVVVVQGGLDITTVLFANRAYGSLKHELFNVGARNPGRKALDMLEIGRPDLDWVSIARGMGVEAARATTNAEFVKAFRAGLATEGPYLIEAVI